MPGYGFGGINWPREPQWWQYLAQHWTQALSVPLLPRGPTFYPILSPLPCTLSVTTAIVCCKEHKTASPPAIFISVAL